MSQALATKPSVITDAPIHPSIATKDLARARDWYADKTGWEPTIEAPGTLIYELAPDAAFTIYESDFAGTAKSTVMNWNPADFRAEMARLRDRGLSFATASSSRSTTSATTRRRSAGSCPTPRATSTPGSPTPRATSWPSPRTGLRAAGSSRVGEGTRLRSPGEAE